jgi:ABC-type multidrug transport system fused ATPase/permease subunit
LYGWEKSFSERVLDVRNNRELRMIRRIGITNAFSFFFWATTPTLVAFASFSAFALTSKQPLTSEKIFPAISLFQLLSFPLAMFSNIISSIIEAVVSVSRLETFLNAEELQKDARMVILPGQRDGYETPSRGQDIVTIEHGEFKWNTSVIEPTLHDINLTVKKGELLAVLGRVGDGKTSLLSCILGEMTRTEGSVLVRGEIAYFAQNSFILSATIKENIVFGHRLDQEFYEIVLDACALRPDLAILPQGDLTEVGEKGVSLSGGQKARIALARAVYARADLYLLDDPLSAVDAHVGKHIFDHVIGPHGLLKTKARILCTNMVTYLPETDDIVMLRRGIILERNDYQTVGRWAGTSSTCARVLTCHSPSR